MFPAGSVAGVPLRVHWSWPLITLALVGLLAEVYAREPGVAQPWLAAGVAALLLSASLLLHELAHALVAQRCGMRVHGIAVFALGGVTEIGDERITAGRELAVALAGPAMSMALAAAASLAWWLGVGPRALAAHLALANWALTLFNLLPGHPLDGGRALKAVIWFLTDEELPASRAAARAARSIGLALAALGVGHALLSGDTLNAAWMLVLGLFLVRGAMDGHRRLALQRTLRGVRAADLMRPALRTVPPEMSLDEFVGRFMLGAPEVGFPVTDAPAGDAPQRLLGMMTLRDVRRYTLGHWAGVAVGQAMTPAHRVRTLPPDAPAGEALHTLLESGEELLPVVDGEVLAGVLWRSDVVSFIQRRIAR